MCKECDCLVKPEGKSNREENWRWEEDSLSSEGRREKIQVMQRDASHHLPPICSVQQPKHWCAIITVLVRVKKKWLLWRPLTPSQPDPVGCYM